MFIRWIKGIKPLKISKKFFVSCQDEFPLMFAISCLLPGISVFQGIEDLANKESNRIKLNEDELRLKVKEYKFKDEKQKLESDR